LGVQTEADPESTSVLARFAGACSAKIGWPDSIRLASGNRFVA
jgi:hypothetical protein